LIFSRGKAARLQADHSHPVLRVRLRGVMTPLIRMQRSKLSSTLMISTLTVLHVWCFSFQLPCYVFFKRVRKIVESDYYLRHVRVSVRLSVWNSSASPWWIFIKLVI